MDYLDAVRVVLDKLGVVEGEAVRQALYNEGWRAGYNQALQHAAQALDGIPRKKAS